MLKRLRFFLQQLAYDLRTGLLLRPTAITGGLALLAVALLAVERRAPQVDLALTRGSWLFHAEAGSAQIVLGTIASTTMTVVAVVYSVLLMALTLTSMQFSPRILAGFLRDRPSQNTLGVFIGTFTYSLVVLRAVHGPPQAFVPVLAVAGAMVLALVSLGWLVYFVHHIALGIQANHLVDRITTDTEGVIDEVHPGVRAPGEVAPAPREAPVPPPGAVPILAATSGYLQLVDEPQLVALATRHEASLFVAPTVGDYVIQGEPLLLIAPPDRATEALVQAGAAAFNLGPVRTLQQDVGFGLRQIVDIALKAISPAVNDPSTAVTCIDHLARLLVRLARRRVAMSRTYVVEVGATTVVVLRRMTFADLLDLAFNQVRQYGRSDMAVALRLLRALGQVARATGQRADLERIARHARQVMSCAEAAFAPEDREELARRHEALAARLHEALAVAPAPGDAAPDRASAVHGPRAGLLPAPAKVRRRAKARR